MSSVKRFYELSVAADEDIEEIFEYTDKEYGQDQAIQYLSDLEELFAQLTDTPALGKSRDEIKTGLRSFPKAEHIVFYRVLKDRIRIVRVLHASRDLPKFFEKPLKKASKKG